jgi:hypothetical protein
MAFVIAPPAPVRLSSFTALRREPTRPPEHRGPSFAAEFDDDTLFFDAFRCGDGRRAVLVGPPLFNLAEPLADLAVTALPGGARVPFRLRQLDRHARITAALPEGASALKLNSSLGTVEVALGESGAPRFDGRRVLMTLSKDNPLPWIQDWIRFHRDRHGADAVLLYDNRSSLYGPEELLEALRAVAGLRAAMVVPWPFKYGPQGTRDGFWDSDFCQNGALEDARWRHLGTAASVLNGDVDELVTGPAGESVFTAAERSWFGVMRYPGRWVVGIQGESPAPSNGALVRHRDFDRILRRSPARRYGVLPMDGNACPPKWTVVPRRTPEGAQWRAHSIAGWPAARLVSGRFGFRHMRPISTQWKYDRTGYEPFDPARHERDGALSLALAGVDWSA